MLGIFFLFTRIACFRFLSFFLFARPGSGCRRYAVGLMSIGKGPLAKASWYILVFPSRYIFLSGRRTRTLLITEGSKVIVRREVLCALHASLSTLLFALCLLFHFSSHVICA
jgi:hypothetical protein